MPWDLIILAATIFAFIVFMIASLASFFGRRGKWLPVLIACAFLTGVGMLVELYQMLTLPPPGELPNVVRQQVPPL